MQLARNMFKMKSPQALSMLALTLLFLATPAHAKITSSTPCRERIVDLVCILPVRKDAGTFSTDCIKNDPDQAQVVSEFEKIYDVIPAVYQRVFCTLPLILVERTPDLGGYSDPIHSKAHPHINGAQKFGLGIDIVLRDKPNDTSAHDLLYTNLSPFNVMPSAHQIATMVAAENPKINLELGNYVMHEFSHILDDLNDVNGYAHSCWNDYMPNHLSAKCLAKPGSFAALSWQDQTTSIYDNTIFPDRKQLYGYFHNYDGGVSPFADIAKADSIYQEMYKTSFLSALAATQPFDDWADSVCLYWVAKNTPGPIVMTMMDSGAAYDLKAQIASQEFAPKLKFIEKFLKRTDLNYPDPYAN